MKDKLIWNVYKIDINKQEIQEFNVFNHGRFNEEVQKLLGKRDEMTKQDFSVEVKHSAMYYFWSKYEYEVSITEPFFDEHTTIGRKIDVYDQLRLNWGQFIDYLWTVWG